MESLVTENTLAHLIVNRDVVTSDDYQQKSRPVLYQYWSALFCAWSGSRTRTPLTRLGILSPVRLPIPPSRLAVFDELYNNRDHTDNDDTQDDKSEILFNDRLISKEVA